MKTIVIILGLLVGQVFAQSISLDRIINIAHYPANDKVYSRVGRFPFDSVLVPKYCDEFKPVVNTPSNRYIQIKFDFKKKKVFTILQGYYYFSTDSITSIEVLNDHTLQVELFIESKEKQLKREYDRQPGEILTHEKFIIDFKSNRVTYNYNSVWNDKFWTGGSISDNLGKLNVNIFE